MKADSRLTDLEALLKTFSEAGQQTEAVRQTILARRAGATDTLLNWLVGKEGRKQLKKATESLKAERNALKAVRKFARSQSKSVSKDNIDGSIAVEPTAELPSKAKNPDTFLAATTPIRSSRKASRTIKSASLAVANRPPVSKGRGRKAAS